MDIAALINQSGFPVAVAVYLLYRESKQRQLEIDNAMKMTVALNNAAKAILDAQEEIHASREERKQLKELLEERGKT
jgi:hypothetical protein